MGNNQNAIRKQGKVEIIVCKCCEKKFHTVTGLVDLRGPVATITDCENCRRAKNGHLQRKLEMKEQKDSSSAAAVAAPAKGGEKGEEKKASK